MGLQNNNNNATMTLNNNMNNNINNTNTGPTYFVSELEINDFPQQARWKVTHKELLTQVQEWTGAVVMPKGIYVPPGREVPKGERKLCVVFQGPTEQSVKNAKIEVKKVLEQYGGMI